jgi:hypothetical protein
MGAYFFMPKTKKPLLRSRNAGIPPSGFWVTGAILMGATHSLDSATALVSQQSPVTSIIV